MPLYEIKGFDVKRINEAPIQKEKLIQKLFERNSLKLLDFYFLETEYQLSNSLRIDTIGIDIRRAPCIVEYKKTYSPGLLSQGLSYLSWLLDHKETFEKEVYKKFPGTIVRWNNVRLIFVCAYFSQYDLDTVKVLPYSIELVKYTYFENGTIYIEKFIEDRKKFSETSTQQIK
ncbi:MAG: hypothetical protein KBH94_03180 [Caldisericia bacterium]|jgi:hypothetical protein|nr:hypothetical protein [Caldisericia bacterium]HQG81884.1 hypothetical protein [Caldisericia bacterium]HXK70163.1 hypothetical protein [Caldisericia bacterium]